MQKPMAEKNTKANPRRKELEKATAADGWDVLAFMVSTFMLDSDLKIMEAPWIRSRGGGRWW